MVAGCTSRKPVRWDTQPLRAILFAPGSEPRKLSRVGEFGADGIVLDLEDAVAETEKDQARVTVRAALAGYDATPVVAVRVNGSDTGRLEDDIHAVVTAELNCLMVPKIEDTSLLARVDALLLEDAHARANQRVARLLLRQLSGFPLHASPRVTPRTALTAAPVAAWGTLAVDGRRQCPRRARLRWP